MKLIFFILILTIIGCNTNQLDSRSHEILINGILNEENDLVLDDGIIVFCRSTNKGKIGYLTVYGLHKTYNNESEYKNIDNHKFVSDFINMKESFDCDSIIRCFILNDTVTTFYNQNNFQVFLFNYSRKFDNEYIINNGPSYSAQMSVIYYLYHNNLYTIYSDLTGFYYASILDNLLTPQENEYPFFNESDD